MSNIIKIWILIIIVCIIGGILTYDLSNNDLDDSGLEFNQTHTKESVYIPSLYISMIELYQEDIIKTKSEINYYEKDYEFMNCNLPVEIKEVIVEGDGMVYYTTWEDKYQSCINALMGVYSNKWELKHQEEQLNYYQNRSNYALIGDEQ